MGHPEIANETPFAVEVLQCSDEAGRVLVVPVIKATYALGGSQPMLAAAQEAVRLSAEHWGDVEQTSCKFEAETAFHKPATDVVLVGHAHAARSRTSVTEVSFRLGTLTKRLRIAGDRVWRKSAGAISASPPEPFERIPLSYDRAYGGWDRSSKDQREHHCDMRNPRGLGYRSKKAEFVEGSPLPNIEDPAHALQSYHAQSVPIGVGFTEPHWEPRRQLGGTYDEAWMAQVSPLLPRDFQPAFMNAASPGLIAQGYLRGDEALLVRGVRADGADLTARLPGITPPVCTMRARSSARTIALPTQLDTVIVDSDANQLLLLWRVATRVPEGLQGVASVRINCANASKPILPRTAPYKSNVIALDTRRNTSAS